MEEDERKSGNSKGRKLKIMLRKRKIKGREGRMDGREGGGREEGAWWRQIVNCVFPVHVLVNTLERQNYWSL